MEQKILESILKYTRDEKVARSSQLGFMKKKSCLTVLIAFCDEMTGRRVVVSVAHLEFNNAFTTVSSNKDISMKYGLDKWTVG